MVFIFLFSSMSSSWAGVIDGSMKPLQNTHEHQVKMKMDHDCCPSVMQVEPSKKMGHAFCPHCGDDCQCGPHCPATLHFATMVNHSFSISFVAQALTPSLTETFSTLPQSVLERPPQVS